VTATGRPVARYARAMRRGLVAALAVALLGFAPAAVAGGPPTGWNGDNPFVCDLQEAGFGPTGPHPEVDPYCVDFDKRRQNVTELGVVDFLSLEPARVAAASPKCWYFQSDHWRGSVVQSDAATKTYEWDGHYFFDKARGEGGVWVTNFNFNGHTADPGAVPGIPPQDARFFGPGTGGFITHDEVQVDPTCAAKAQQSPPYRPLAPNAVGCLGARGQMTTRAIGPVALGAAESGLREALGAPNLIRRGFLRWCLQAGGSLRAGNAADRSGDSGQGDDPTLVALTTSPAYSLRGIHAGSTLRALRRAFAGERPAFTAANARVWLLRRGLVAGVLGGKVTYLAVYDAAKVRDRRSLRTLLQRGG
jgi:hypothetical protein